MAWDIRGKRVLITGATSGIGLEASVDLRGPFHPTRPRDFVS